MNHELSSASFLKSANNENSFKGINIPSIELPKGGGALKGIDEQFAVNSVNGTASISIPLPSSAARALSPQLSVRYNSGSGNGVFGLGWGIDLGSIRRNTDKFIPTYQDEDETDDFMLSGMEELVPQFETDVDGNLIAEGDGFRIMKRMEMGYEIKSYIPRTEGSFSRIEKITNLGNGLSCWRVTNRNNQTTYYGLSASSQLADPQDPRHIFQWMPELSVDHMGNCVRYIYDKDDRCKADSSLLWNENRQIGSFTNIYISKVLYGNKTPYYCNLDSLPDEVILPEESDFMFSTEFEYDMNRPDALSSYRSGFEIRTLRLCRRVLLYHNFEELGGKTLIRSTVFHYKQDEFMTLLTEAVSNGYVKKNDGSYVEKSLPAQVFHYEEHMWNSTIHNAPQDDQLPSGLNGWQLMDLYNEGIPGLLYQDSNSWYYKHNRGSAQFSEAVKVMDLPSFRGQTVSFSDLEADGRKQLVCNQCGHQGYFQMDDEGVWESFKTFHKMPNIDMSQSDIRMIDLNGDGKPDLLVTENHALTWYASEGKDGYSDRQSLSTLLEEGGEPAVMFSDSSQSIYLADMTGDGRTDIVRIRQGEVCYWPNLGYGRFGNKVTMGCSPVFSSMESFQPQRIMLADIDGTGTTDLVYLDNDGLRVWRNGCGNRFSTEPYTICAFPEIHSMSQVTLSDFLGSGTLCLVWSSLLGKDHSASLKYIDLMGSRKPYLLNRYSNSMGKEVLLEYKTSTAYYLEDLKQGNPWKTSLHFPVHCLSKVVTKDLITGWVFANSYRYRDGFYDHDEREFRGFAYVEQKDTETVEQPATNLQNHELDQEPVISLSWMHTGTHISGDVEITSSKLLHGYNINLLTSQEQQQALRCVRGMVLKNEIRTEDGKLFQQQVARSKVEIIQPKGQNRYAVFMTVPLESRSYTCEGNMEDARISQSLTLDTDEYGQVLSSAQIAYPRQMKDVNIPIEAQLNQAETRIVLSISKTTHDIDNSHVYLLRQACEAKTYEIKQLHKANEYYTVEDFQFLDWDQANLLEHNKTLFYNEQLDAPLPLYEHTFPVIPFESYAQIYSKDEYMDVFQGRVTEEMLLNSHYVKQSDETWWVRSGHPNLLYPGEEVSSAKKRFYLPVSYEDAFGTVTTVEYYKDYYLFVNKTTNAIGLSDEVQEFNFRTLQPEVMVDVNGNKSQCITDELGMVKAVALLGKGEEADNLDGYSEITSDNEQMIIEQLLTEEESIIISSLAKQLLQGASMRYIYDTEAFMRCGKPLTSIVVTREEYYAIDHDAPVQVAYCYASGSGAMVLEKVQAEKPSRNGNSNSSFRWLGNGRTILNNKGNALMAYEPYFSDTPAYEDDASVRELGVSPILHYDALGRMIRTDFPDGTFQKQEFDAWKMVCYDAGDCVLESDWYKIHKNDRVGEQSEVYAGTPAVICFDTLGQPSVMMDYLKETRDGSVRMLMTMAKRDIRGYIQEVVDARGNSAVSYRYDMLGRPLYEKSMDKGQRWSITDMAGKVIRSWDEREHMFEVEYDVLQRPILSRTYDLSNGKTYITSRIIYGDNLLCEDFSNIRELQERNVLTMIVENYDTAGKVETMSYDFRGMPLETVRTLAKNYKEMVNWTEDSLARDLENRSFCTSMVVDAMGRIKEQTNPDGSRCINIYNAGGLMTAQQILFCDGRKDQMPIRYISYNAKRQREHMQYGNGVSVKFTYDEKTYRVNRILSCREDGSVLQDLNYTYDAVGRVVCISDQNVPAKFFDGQRIKGESLYSYDSLGRLVSASGRENDVALKFIQGDNHSDDVFQAILRTGDVMAMHNYTQVYMYDDANNILQMKHKASGNNWTRNYTYESDSNKLLSTEVGNMTYKYKYHDKHGFMESMPHLAEISWDAFERIAYTSKQLRSDGGIPEITYYQYDGEGNRVRKITECQASGSCSPRLKDERIYQGAYEKYSCFSGANSGLERETISVLDQGHRYVMFEVRNSIDDGTAKELTRYQIDNHQGSACLELDENAHVISYEEYHPFGTTAYQAVNKDIKAASKRYRYTGMERDEETGLSYHSARYYISWLGRWISCDPIGIKGGINLYCYCENEPVGHVDFTGHDGFNYWETDFGKIHAAFGYGVVNTWLETADGIKNFVCHPVDSTVALGEAIWYLGDTYDAAVAKSAETFRTIFEGSSEERAILVGGFVGDASTMVVGFEVGRGTSALLAKTSLPAKATAMLATAETTFPRVAKTVKTVTKVYNAATSFDEGEVIMSRLKKVASPSTIKANKMLTRLNEAITQHNTYGHQIYDEKLALLNKRINAKKHVDVSNSTNELKRSGLFPENGRISVDMAKKKRAEIIEDMRNRGYHVDDTGKITDIPLFTEDSIGLIHENSILGLTQTIEDSLLWGNISLHSPFADQMKELQHKQISSEGDNPNSVVDFCK